MVGKNKAATDAICGGFTPPLLQTTRGAAVQSTETLGHTVNEAVARAAERVHDDALADARGLDKSDLVRAARLVGDELQVDLDIAIEEVAAERDRADRAETALDQAPHDSMCAVDYMVACDCWKSEATA